MLAGIVQSPTLAIDEDEAEKLAGAIQKVSRHYNMPTMAQETIDWIGLIQTCGAIYGPRVMAASIDRRARREAARAKPAHPSAPANVTAAAAAPRAATPMPSATMNGSGDIDPRTGLPKVTLDFSSKGSS